MSSNDPRTWTLKQIYEADAAARKAAGLRVGEAIHSSMQTQKPAAGIAAALPATPTAIPATPATPAIPATAPAIPAEPSTPAEKPK